MLGESLAAARHHRNQRLIAYALRYLGYAGAVDGDIVSARTHLAEALPIFDAVGATLAAARVTDDLGEYEFRGGNAELALRHGTEALSVFRAFNDTRDIVYSLGSISGYLVSLVRYDEAEQCAREALELARENKLEVIAVGALLRLASIATRRPRLGAEQSSTAYEKVGAIAGFADAWLAAKRSPRRDDLRQECDRVVAALRDVMGAEALANRVAAGAAMTEEQAIEEGLLLTILRADD